MIFFHTSVADTTSYNIYAVLRHTDFNNMWMQLKTVAPDNSVTDQQVKLKLGDNAKGWLGSAMDIIGTGVLIQQYPIKLKKGTLLCFQANHARKIPAVCNERRHSRKKRPIADLLFFCPALCNVNACCVAHLLLVNGNDNDG